MRVLLVIFVFFLVTSNSEAQKNFDNYYFRDISLDFGIYPSLSGSHTAPILSGQILSLKTSYYFSKRFGYRLGITSVSDMEGASSLYSAPIYLTIRSTTQRDLSISSHTHSFSDLLLQLFMSIFPKNVELNLGTNLGVATPDNGMGYIFWNGNEYLYQFEIDNRFYATADASLRLNYKIWRFGIVLSPTVSYLLTENWAFRSELPNDENNGFKPTWFLMGTIGLSFAF